VAIIEKFLAEDMSRIKTRQQRLDLAVYLYLAKAVVETTKPASYKVLMSGAVT